MREPTSILTPEASALGTASYAEAVKQYHELAALLPALGTGYAVVWSQERGAFILTPVSRREETSTLVL